MNKEGSKRGRWILIALLVATNLLWALAFHWNEDNWSLKYGSDIQEGAALLRHYDRTYKDTGKWPKDIEHWRGISSLHLASTNAVDCRQVLSFASDFGGERIEIREANNGSPYLALGKGE